MKGTYLRERALRAGRGWLWKAALLLVMVNQGKILAADLAWVRQFGSTNQDSADFTSVDREGNAYVVGTYAFRGNFGGLFLDAAGSPQAQAMFMPYLVKVSAAGEVVWAKNIGQTSFVLQVKGMALDPRGYIYVTGSFVGNADFESFHLETSPPDLDDVFLLKYALDGNLVWARRYGGSDIERASGICLTETGDLVLSGTYRRYGALGDFSLPGYGLEHVWMARISGNGDVQWVNAASSSIWIMRPPKVSADSEGNVYVAGGFMWSIEFWESFTCTTNEVPVSVTEVTTNVVCYTNLNTVPPTVECTNQLVWTNFIVITNVVECSPRFPADGGKLNGLPGDTVTLFLAKYDPAGKCLWARTGGGPATDLVADANRDVYVTGSMQGGFAVPYSAAFDQIVVTGENSTFLVKFDPAGRVLWANNEGGFKLALGPERDIYALGAVSYSRVFDGKLFTALGASDLFVAQYDPSGNSVAAWQLGDSDSEIPGAMAVDKEGNLLVVGSTYHLSDANIYQQTNYGGMDTLVARLVREGPHILQQPERLVIRSGSNAVFTVQATNSSTMQYEWLKNGAPIADDSRISGFSEPVLIIRDAQRADEGDYSVRISAANGLTLSAAARLRIEGLMTFLGIEPGPYSAFTVTFAGNAGSEYDVEVSSNLYTWRHLTNGVAIGGILKINDFSQNISTQRFYRAVAR